jgi:hypothetical protein
MDPEEQSTEKVGKAAFGGTKKDSRRRTKKSNRQSPDPTANSHQDTRRAHTDRERIAFTEL